MTVTGKTISVMALLQIAAVVIACLGGHLGMSIVRKLYGGALAPQLTVAFARWGLWPMLFPLVWTAIVMMRVSRGAPSWELLVWFLLAGCFFVILGGGGVMAAVITLITC